MKLSRRLGLLATTALALIASSAAYAAPPEQPVLTRTPAAQVQLVQVNGTGYNKVDVVQVMQTDQGQQLQQSVAHPAQANPPIMIKTVLPTPWGHARTPGILDALAPATETNGLGMVESKQLAGISMLGTASPPGTALAHGGGMGKLFDPSDPGQSTRKQGAGGSTCIT